MKGCRRNYAIHDCQGKPCRFAVAAKCPQRSAMTSVTGNMRPANHDRTSISSQSCNAVRLWLTGSVAMPLQELRLFEWVSSVRRNSGHSVGEEVAIGKNVRDVSTRSQRGAHLMDGGKGKPTISGFPKPLPTRWSKRVSAATSFYAAFRPLFLQVGRWCTGIPCETVRAGDHDWVLTRRGTVRQITAQATGCMPLSHALARNVALWGE